MNVQYVKDYKNNYLVIIDNKVFDNDYRLKMITENDIEGLLKCKERMVNSDGMLYYEVSGKQSFEMIFNSRKLTSKELKNLFDQLEKVCSNLQRFLLPEDKLVILPEYIFVDYDTQEYLFLYYPFKEDGNNDDVKSLSDYFIDHIDNQDMDVVEAVYRFADAVNKDHCNLYEAVSFFNKEFEEEVSEPAEPENIYEETYIEEETEKKPLWKRIWEYFFPNNVQVTQSSTVTDVVGCYEQEVLPSSDSTVFIPWIENTENKLYGLGRNNKNHIDLNHSPLVVGKMPNMADMVINDNSISRMHARFTHENNHYYMQDLNSTNGTFHNGMRLNPNEKVCIEAGDEIALGKLKFIYR